MFRWEPNALQQDHLRILFCQDVGDSNKTILYDSDYFLNIENGSRSPPANTPMARSWNGSQAHNSGRPNMEVGSFKDQRHDWRPSYMRTMPSLSISDQNQHNNHRQVILVQASLYLFSNPPLFSEQPQIRFNRRDDLWYCTTCL